MGNDTVIETQRFLETQRAFDSVAPDYDGPRGNNRLIQAMRTNLWRVVENVVPLGSRLLDLGCGTGLDAVYFASKGYRVVATDWSPKMVERTINRAAENGAYDRVTTERIGIQELHRLYSGDFDLIYSDLGPLNCVEDLTSVSRECANRLAPGGKVVFSVIGKWCPWEFIYYVLRGKWSRAIVRFSRKQVPIQMNGHTIWANYHSPVSFAAHFSNEFEIENYRGMSIFVPPPYLIDIFDRLGFVSKALQTVDRLVCGFPIFRNFGDHFLITMTKKKSEK